MTRILSNVFRWILKHIASLLIIIAILIGAKYLSAENFQLESTSSILPKLEETKREIDTFVGSSNAAISKKLSGVESESVGTIENRINKVTNDIASHKNCENFLLVSAMASDDGAFNILNCKLEIEFLNQELVHLRKVKSAAESTLAYLEAEKKREELRKKSIHAYDLVQRNQAEIQRLEEINTRCLKNPLTKKDIHCGQLPLTQAEHDIDDLKNLRLSLISKNNKASADFKEQEKRVASLKKLNRPGPFKLQNPGIESHLVPLTKGINELKTNRENNWVHKLYRPICETLPQALAILIAAILMPAAIKAFLYFFIAPAASTRAAIHLLPQTTGIIENVDGARDSRSSAVSQTISIDRDHEALIRPEYLQSTSHSGNKETKWLLNNKYPLSSLAAGMTALTHIRTDSVETVVVSSTKDPFSEIGVISIPEGSAVVLQPHYLIGVVQLTKHPISITHHWRLGSLHAWLTLQLRYMAFHGPAKLIVNGCRGIKIEPAGMGRCINQAATIGFTANLAYSTTRCETFSAYFLGKQELFNDNFAGATGFYIYEEMPRFGKKTGINGRGLQGITDSLLKVFGV